MNPYLPKTLALALLLGTLARAAPPETDRGVVADLFVAKVAQKADGQKTFESARGAAPGDIVEYRVTYRNTAWEQVRGVVGTLAIPANRMSYVLESATRGSMLEASVDGKTFEPVPLRRLVVHEDGSMKMEPIPASEYRYLRWLLGDLPAHGSVTVSARMHIHDAQVVLATNAGQ